MKKFGNILWGLVFILVGAIVACNALGITDINLLFSGWWTMFIIIPCFIGLFKEHEKTGNIIGLVIGIALLLACQDFIDFGMIWKLALPAVLVIIGFSLIFRDTFSKKISKEISEISKKTKNDTEYSATFASQDVNYDGEVFTGVILNAVFGGVKCDLRKAKIEQDAVINTSAIFGGIDILVPDDVKIKIKSTPIFGGVSDERKHNVNQDAAHTIYIN